MGSQDTGDVGCGDEGEGGNGGMSRFVIWVSRRGLHRRPDGDSGWDVMNLSGF